MHSPNEEKISVCKEITNIIFTNSDTPIKKIGIIIEESERNEPITRGFFYEFLTKYFLSRITCREVMALMQVSRPTAYNRIREVRDFLDKEPFQIVTRNEFFYYWYDLHIDDLWFIKKEWHQNLNSLSFCKQILYSLRICLNSLSLSK